MSKRNIQQLHTEAGEAVSGFGRQATKLILTHAGITLGANLAVALIGYLLDLGIAQTSGLADIATLTLLETVQQFLQIIVTVALPFWQMGYVFTAMQMARRQSADTVHLLTGFRFFGPVLRLNILRFALFLAVMMLGAQIGSYLYLLTPGGKDLLLSMETILEQMEGQTMDYAALLENEAYVQAVLPSLPIALACGGLLGLPLLYRLRMADYVLLDGPYRGGVFSLVCSFHMTRKNVGNILRLDLRFWWYYLLQLVTVALCYADLLLPLMGVELAVEKEMAAYVFYALALLLEFGLFVWQKNRVTATYVLLYEQLRQPQPEVPKPAPAHVPWNK